MIRGFTVKARTRPNLVPSIGHLEFWNGDYYIDEVLVYHDLIGINTRMITPSGKDIYELDILQDRDGNMYKVQYDGQRGRFVLVTTKYGMFHADLTQGYIQDMRLEAVEDDTL